MSMDDYSFPATPPRDSGCEPAALVATELPGVLQGGCEFLFHASLAFVTYSHSRVENPEDFHRYLRESLDPHLPLSGGPEGGKGTVQIFGSKELHEDGTHHYHVMLKFEPRVHWRKARQRFSVWIEVDGKKEVDTTSVLIRKKKAHEAAQTFLQSVQSYIAKDGHVFGEWIGTCGTPAREVKKYSNALIAATTRSEAEALFRSDYKRQYCLQHKQVAAYLKTRLPDPATPHVPNFECSPWRLPVLVKQWLSMNFGERRKGQPRPLVIEGASRTGKTEWALSFGKPANMSARLNVDELTKPGITHIVLNNIEWKKFPNKKHLVDCQELVMVPGKGTTQKSVGLGVPVIITCNSDNSVLLDTDLARYLKKAGATIVKLGKKKLFVLNRT